MLLEGGISAGALSGGAGAGALGSLGGLLGGLGLGAGVIGTGMMMTGAKKPFLDPAMKLSNLPNWPVNSYAKSSSEALYGGKLGLPSMNGFLNGGIEENTLSKGNLLNGQAEDNNPFKISLPKLQQQGQTNPFAPSMAMPEIDKTETPFRDFHQVPMPYNLLPIHKALFASSFPQMNALEMGAKNVDYLPTTIYKT